MKLTQSITLLLIVLFICACTSVNNQVIKSNIIPEEREQITIINAHEHIQSLAQAEKFLESMDKANISKTFLLGSPKATIYGGQGFEDPDSNNAEILNIIHEYPDRFEALCTIDPRDIDKLEKLQDCVREGSKGLKLYSGHYAMFYKYLGPLNTTEMDEIYSYCEKNNIPILFHINLGKENLLGEFEDILKRYPDLIINCPHFCLSSIKISRLRYLFDNYPNVYTDVSFGYFVEDGLKRISNNASMYHDFIIKYRNRFMFGTDMVVTANKRKTAEWIYNLTMCYRDMLEKSNYQCVVAPDFSGNFNGLNLDKDTLKIIYEDVPKEFLNMD